MILPIMALVSGLLLLLWSADRFVEGSAATARYFGMPPLLIGMVIIGFGTSAPEMIVSILSAYQGNPGIALGNAYGSNITNIALILGVTVLISPITVHSQILRKELPMLMLVTLLTAWQLWDGTLSRADALILLGVFMALMAWAIRQGLRNKPDALSGEVKQDMEKRRVSLGGAIFWLVTGLILLIASSRLLVWGAVEIAQQLGVSDLIIGLTVVAAGTSLPELASSVIAARKGEHDLALGNIIGSNLFNTLAVVGIAGSVHPMAVGSEVLSRDVLVMALLTGMLFAFSYGFNKPGRINRYEGGLLLVNYIVYTLFLIAGVVTG